MTMAALKTSPTFLSDVINTLNLLTFYLLYISLYTAKITHTQKYIELNSPNISNIDDNQINR